jgi:hypothetical protein
MHHHNAMEGEMRRLEAEKILQVPITQRLSPGTMEAQSPSSEDEDDSDVGDEKDLGLDDGKPLKSSTDKPQGKIAKKKTGGSGRRRIEIKFIENKSRRQVTFSRRKRGLMKKAYELTTLTGTQALVLIASETGHVYTFATPKLQPVVTLREGKELIQSCLNAPDNNYPPSDFIANTTSTHGQTGGGPAPKTEPHGSPQQPPMPHPAQHPHHPEALLSNMYGQGMPHGVVHGGGYPPGSLPPHMGGQYNPHELYLSGAGPGGSLPPMSLGQHMSPHHDPSKRDHLQ